MLKASICWHGCKLLHTNCTELAYSPCSAVQCIQLVGGCDADVLTFFLPASAASAFASMTPLYLAPCGGVNSQRPNEPSVSIKIAKGPLKEPRAVVMTKRELR